MLQVRPYQGWTTRPRYTCLWVPHPGPPSPARRYHTPFQGLLRVVFALDGGINPSEARPVTLFTTDPDVASETVSRIARDCFHCECYFRAAKQYPGPTAWRVPSAPPS